MSQARRGSFEDLMSLAAATPRIEEICRELRALVFQVDPGAVEVVRLGDRAASYGVGPKKMSEGYCYILPYRDWVNLGFYQGVDLEDPSRLLEGSGARMRHVKVRSVADAGREGLRGLLKEALRVRRQTPGSGR